MCEDFINEYAECTFAGPSDAVRLIAGPVLKTLVQRICQILSGDGCYDEFGCTFDGTPSFAEAEAITIRIVTKDWEVIELLVRCGLYKRKLDSSALTSHIIDTITKRAGLSLENWMSTHQDRARVNISAIDGIYAGFPQARPAKNFCCTHTISNAGKKAIGGEGSATYAELFRKNWQAVINHPGKARGRFAEIFGNAPSTASGVRFFVKYEQLAELFQSTPDRIMKEVIAWCVDRNVSETSSKAMMSTFNPDTDARASLAMAIVEIAAVAEGVRPFAQGCYTLEGDSCLILRALSVFKHMENYIANGYSTPKLEDAVDRALPLLQHVELGYVGRVESATKAITLATADVTAMELELTRLNDLRQEANGGTSSRGRVRVGTARSRDNDRLESIVEELVNAKVEYKQLKKVAKETKECETKVVATFDEWKTKFPHRNKVDLMEHGKNLLSPVGVYYNKQFLNEVGDCHQMRVMSEAAQIFDPIFLSKQSTADIVTVLHYLADKLLVSNFRHFNEKFMDRLKKEMPGLVKEAKSDHDLDRIPSTRQHQTRMQTKIKRKKLPKDTVLDWKKDAGEYAQRIWKWWKPRNDKFPCHGLAIRLIVLAQLSSCSVERVFSKLERIRKATGDSLKEDMCEIRLMLQVNGDLDDMYDALVLNYEE